MEIKKPESLVHGIELTDKLIALTEAKAKTLKEMRRALAHEAIKHGLLDGRLIGGKPCPICGHPASLFSAKDLGCRICRYDGNDRARIPL
jgi:hypothetical protein